MYDEIFNGRCIPLAYTAEVGHSVSALTGFFHRKWLGAIRDIAIARPYTVKICILIVDSHLQAHLLKVIEIG